MTSENEVKEILIDNEFLTNQNSNYRSYCQDLADFFTPRKAWINTMKITGEQLKFNFLYDSTAIISARETSAGFNTYLTNPSSRWFGYQYQNKKIKDSEIAKTFAHDVEDWAFATLKDSNFYEVAPEWFHGKLIFGTGTFSMLDDDKDFVKYNDIPVGQVNRVVDANGELIALYRNFPLTARQAFKLWGRNAGKSVLESLENKPHQEFEFVHYVGERFDRETDKEDAANMPYKSLWINKKDKQKIAESGFIEMPYFSSVFYKDSSDPNGSSAAMDIFPWVKLINAMSRLVIRGAMKQADPAYMMPSRGLVLPLNLNPGAMNYRDAKTPNDAIQLLPVSNGRIDIGKDLIEYIAGKIERGMFVNLFRSFDDITKQMPVIEVQHRISQDMALLGPVVNRDNRTLGKMLIRLISMGRRDTSSGFPAIPEELLDETYELVYLSQLARAQQQSEIREIQNFLGDVASLGQIIPGVYDKIDEDKTLSVLHRIRGVTPEILRGDADVDQMRKHREEQNQLLQTMQAGSAVADIAKSGSEAEKNSAMAASAGK